jgi:hypothetical protein
VTSCYAAYYGIVEAPQFLFVKAYAMEQSVQLSTSQNQAIVHQTLAALGNGHK